MIVLAGAILGALLGVYNAKRRGGSRLDMAQHATATAIAFALIGLIITIVIHRTLV
ncbi:hypothetical protein [Aestuariivita sp.]|jgi:hypothetical protein|uniref:hypothetical protein n=1 Tax=Aestuariivita sp. TaxID=1872407 RepID=UPI00216B6883|nr:hypothetical protein [Aestuariivita sp.]MCE8009253.1 hypothetical protein [Aestuariivita sp.]